MAEAALTGAERAVAEAVDVDALVRTAADLIAIPSVSAEEGPAQQLAAEALRGFGADVETWTINMATLAAHPAYSAEVERATALGVLGSVGDGEGPTLLLDAHTDVVPPGEEELWTSPAFEPALRGGRLYGRGACDTKGGLAAMMHAVKAVVDAGVRLRGRVLVAPVVGEEDGGCGTLAVLARGVTADGCVVVEPTDLAVAPAVAGALSFRVRLRGLAAHGALRKEGVSAIERLPVVLRGLLDLEQRRNDREADPLFGWLDTPFAICTGRVEGGDWPSSEADWLVLEGRYGVAPGEDLDEARAELEAGVAEAARTDPWLATHPPVVEWWGGQFLPGRTPADAPLVGTVTGAVADTAGRPADVRGMPYGCDLGLTTGVGGIPSVVFGPGDVRHAHRPDEHVAVDDLAACARALAVAIVRFCA